MFESRRDLVSVVLPTFNRAKVLERAIVSVLNQTHKNFELIIIDDASTDNTKEIVNKFQNSRIQYIRTKKNKGGAVARNIGIKAARGDYIAFLDSDDEWLPKKLEKQIFAIKKSKLKNEYKLVYCTSQIYTGLRKKNKPNRGIKRNERVSDYLFVNEGFIQTSSILITAELGNEISYTESLRRHQDYDFVFKAEKKNTEFIFVDKPLVIIHWEKHGNFMNKGWTPEFSENFAKNNIESFSEKSYWNFIFKNVVINAARHKSKLYSLKKFISIKLKYIKFRNYLSFIKNLIFPMYK